MHLLALLNFTNFVATSGYAAVFILSVAQSCCIPTSSELTLGFAGVLAAEGKLSLPGAIVAGVAGEVVGAFIAWFVGRTGGRAFVDRYGKYILVSSHDLDRAEAWYDRHGPWGVFASRLVPVIRNFVALPAGVAEVPIVRFGLLTLAGSAVWDSAMALIGYEVGSRYNKIMHGVSDAGYVLGVLAVLAIAFVIYHRYRSYKAATSATPAGRHAVAADTRRGAAAGAQAPREGWQSGPASAPGRNPHLGRDSSLGAGVAGGGPAGGGVAGAGPAGGGVAGAGPAGGGVAGGGPAGGGVAGAGPAGGGVAGAGGAGGGRLAGGPIGPPAYEAEGVRLIPKTD